MSLFPKQLTATDLREIPMFALGVILLAIMLYSSWHYPSLQYNIVWMVVLSLNVAIVVAFLPFSAEFNIPGWAKFGGSAAVLIGCLDLTFHMAAQDLQKENSRLSEQVDAMGKQIATLQVAADGQKALSPAIKSLLDAIDQTKTQLTLARDQAHGATTNTNDLRGCLNAAGAAAGTATLALSQLQATRQLAGTLQSR